MQFSIQTFLFFIASLAAVLTLFQALKDPTRQTRREVTSILLSPASNEEQIEQLAAYVKLGDHIADVKQRLTQYSDSPRSFDTHVEVTFFFDGVNLELHHTPLGEIIGIKKHAYGNGDPPVWLRARQPWPGPRPPQNAAPQGLWRPS